MHDGSSDARAHADLAAARGGDAEAFARLMDAHRAAVGRILWRFTRDHGDWEALVQDTFVEMHRSLDRYRADAPLAHWLARIATRVGYASWKRRRRERNRRTAVLGDGRAATPIAIDPARAAEIVHDLLARLRPDDRLALTLVHLEGLSLDVAADRGGWSRSGMKMRVLRARRRLADVARAQGIEPGDYR